MSNKINMMVGFPDGTSHIVTCSWDGIQHAIVAPNSNKPLDRTCRIANEQQGLDNATIITLAIAAGYQNIG